MCIIGVAQRDLWDVFVVMATDDRLDQAGHEWVQFILSPLSSDISIARLKATQLTKGLYKLAHAHI